MPSRAALAVARQVLSALARTHRLGVVHRDLKPENILLVEDADGRERVKVLDFGIAKVRDFETLTGSLQIIGTPGYIAPEYIQAARIDGRADLFSLGVVLYEMVTGGRHPFDYKYHGDLLVKPLTDDPVPPSVRRPGVEPEVEALVLRALRKDPDQRFRDAFHMREAVDEVLAALDARDADPHGRPTTVAPPRGGVDTVSALEPPEDGPAAPSPVEHAPATTAFGRRPALLRPTPETPAFQPRRLTLAVAAVHESRERLTSATPPGAAPVAGWRERAAGRLAVLEGRVAAARWLAEEGGALRLALRQARAAHGARTDALAERVSHLGGEADGLALRRRVLIEHPESGRPGELAEVELALLAARRQQAVAARDLEQIRRDLDREHDRHAEALRDVLAALERALELVEACQQDLGDTLAGADGGGAGP